MAKNLHVQVLKNSFPRLIQAAPQKADAALRALATEVVTEAKLLITNSPPTGREYARGKSRRIHVASAPGNPPRVDTGALRASIRWRKVTILNYEVVDGVQYGLYLEMGTTEIEARPFMIPAAVNAMRKADDIFDQFLLS